MSVRLPSGVLAQFAENIALIDNASTNDGTFTPSGYRFTLDREPDSAMEGKYFLGIQKVGPRDPQWGTGENFIESIVTVQTSYYRGGGDADGGDRQSVMRDAADDCQILGDVCENPLNYNGATSGIRKIRCVDSRKIHDMPRAEVWETTFEVQHRSDLATEPVFVPVASGGGVSILGVTGEFSSVSLTGADEDVIAAPLTIDFDDFDFETVKFRLLGFAYVTTGSATFRIRMGGTLGASDGTEVASASTSGTSYDVVTGIGSAFANPGGQVKFQVSIEGDTVGATSWLQGIQVAVLDGEA